MRYLDRTITVNVSLGERKTAFQANIEVQPSQRDPQYLQNRGIGLEVRQWHCQRPLALHQSTVATRQVFTRKRTSALWKLHRSVRVLGQGPLWSVFVGGDAW